MHVLRAVACHYANVVLIISIFGHEILRASILDAVIDMGIVVLFCRINIDILRVVLALTSDTL
jgi:hypothetical protein